ncbi:unnamed protein product, partial [Discosporangium mesarthrocarpum]
NVEKDAARLPLVVNTWGGSFAQATERAWEVISHNQDALLDAVEQGCNVCEDIQCDWSVGFGGHPDSRGEVTLDAMIMFGPSHSVGAVGYLRRIKNAISAARLVMEHTAHTMLTGEGATRFAAMMGLAEETLATDASDRAHKTWEVEDACQPNYYRDLVGADEGCPPYPPPAAPPAAAAALGDEGGMRGTRGPRASTGRSLEEEAAVGVRDPARLLTTPGNHDTIGMVVVSGGGGDLACGTTTNGAAHKVAGRVGDAPVVGAGCYVDNAVGGAAATGDGDVMVRLLPAFRAVEAMRGGAPPVEACARALCAVAR